MALWENTLMFYKYYCVDNNDFLNKIFDKTIFELIKNDIVSKKETLLNKDITQELKYELLLEKYNDNNLILTRMGNVESSFICMYYYNKKIYWHKKMDEENLDIYMKKNAGLYYKNEKDKKTILDWWCENTIEIIKQSELSACYLHLYWDLILWSLLDLKKGFYNYGNIHKLILQNSGGKKILYIGNAIKSIEYSHNYGIQNMWNFKIPNFELYLLKTPQTTLNMEYPDDNIKITIEKLFHEIITNFSDFDTAIFGCGAYGPPLMNLLAKKFKNKNMLYLGSLCYTMFGLYTDGMPIPKYDKDIVSKNWIPVLETYNQSFINIDNAKYWNKPSL